MSPKTNSAKLAAGKTRERERIEQVEKEKAKEKKKERKEQQKMTIRASFKGGDLDPGERHSRDTRDDGTVTLCTLRAATVLSRNCRADLVVA